MSLILRLHQSVIVQKGTVVESYLLQRGGLRIENMNEPHRAGQAEQLTFPKELREPESGLGRLLIIRRVRQDVIEHPRINSVQAVALQ